MAKKVLTTYVQDEVLKNVEQDTFGHQHVADAVLDSIIDSDPPFIIGIFGGWGSGKSSLLRMISEKLNKKGISNATIDAWRYTATENLQRAFLVHIAQVLAPKFLASLRRHLYTTEQETVPFKKSDLENLANMSWRQLLTAVVVFLVSSLVILGFFFGVSYYSFTSTAAAGEIFDVLNFIDKYSIALIAPLFLAFFSFLRLYVIERPVTVIHERIDAEEIFSDYFEKVVNNATKGKSPRKKKLVIFVDNLDRLTDDKMVEALESLKTYISNERCIFIVACDDNVVRSVINASKRIPSRKTDASARAGEHYLDKFFQQTFRLPEYLRLNLHDFAISNFGTTKLHSTLRERGIDVKYLLSILLPSDISSPRKVKRLINDFIALFEIVRRREDEVKGQLRKGILTEKPEFLAKFSTLRAEYPVFYQKLIQNSSILDELTTNILSKKEEEIDACLDRIYGKTPDFQERISLLSYLSKTVTITTSDIGLYIWLSQDKMALGLKQEHATQIRTLLSDGNIQLFRKLYFEIEDFDYRSRLLDTATRIVQDGLLGLDQQNGTRVLADILGEIDQNQRTEIAHIVVSLIPNFSSEGFSAFEILNVIRWARAGISNQGERLLNRVVDLLKLRPARLETFSAVMANADVLKMHGKTVDVQNWLDSFFGLDPSAFYIPNPTQTETSEPAVEDMAAQVVEVGNWIIDSADDYFIDETIANDYFFGATLTYLTDLLLGEFHNESPIPLDEGQGEKIEKIFNALSEHARKSGKTFNFTKEMQRLAVSGYRYEYEYAVRQISLFLGQIPENEVASIFEAILVGFEKLTIDDDSIPVEVLETGLNLMLKVRTKKEVPIPISGEFQDCCARMMESLYAESIVGFVENYGKHFGDSEGPFINQTLVKNFAKNVQTTENDALLASAFVKLSQVVNDEGKKEIDTKLRSLVALNQAEPIQSATNLISQLGASSDFAQYFKASNNWLGYISNTETPEILASKLVLLKKLINLEIEAHDSAVNHLVTVFPCGGGTQANHLLTFFEDFADKISSDTKANLFNLLSERYKELPGGDAVRALSLVASWFHLGADTERSTFHDEVNGQFKNAPKEYLKVISKLWGDLKPEEVEKDLVLICQVTEDEGYTRERNRQIKEGMGVLAEGTRKETTLSVWNQLYDDNPAKASGFIETAKEQLTLNELKQIRAEVVAFVLENAASEDEDESQHGLDLIIHSARSDLRDLPMLVDMFIKLFQGNLTSIELALSNILDCFDPAHFPSDYKHKLAEIMGQISRKPEYIEEKENILKVAKDLGLMWWTYNRYWQDKLVS